MHLWLLLLATACSDSFEPAETTGGVPLLYPDSDGDTIMDHHEGPLSAQGEVLDTGIPETPPWQLLDTDGDGTPNYLDTDSDDDGIPDEVEAGDADLLTLPVDADLDGTADFMDTDSDGNCLPDADEGVDDPDGDGLGNYTDTDDDGDGLLDVVEIGDGCAVPDTDGDGVPDLLDADSDGDGIGDAWEAGTSAYDDEPRDTDGDGTPDYLDTDSDGDGLPDADEAGVASPEDEPRDTDGDGMYDFADTDSDGDGLTDREETNVHHTDPYDSDTDGDGFTDGSEVLTGSNPNDASSGVEGIYVEVPERVDVEESFTFTLDIQMGDIGFLLDTTCSMSSTLSAMKNEFAQIQTQVASRIPDAQYAVATFDDYNYSGMGSGQDKPYELLQEVTSDTGRIQSVLSSIGLHSGDDATEASHEALYQALTGAGYDQNCNGRYDSQDDVKPFVASASDPFGGTGGQFHTGAYPGGGLLGGMGFRDYALPILVYATDAPMRDPTHDASPHGCPKDATPTDVINAANNLGAYLIGISVGSWGPVSQMNTLADGTGSVDASGNRLVFTWTGSSSAFRDTIVQAIEDLVQAVRFSEVTLEVEGDTHGFVIDVQPRSYKVSGAVSGQQLDFTLTFRGAVEAGVEDQLYGLTLNVYGDGTILLDSLDIWIVVPGDDA